MKRNRVYSAYLLMATLLIPLWEFGGGSSTTVRLMISRPSAVVEYALKNISDLAIATSTTFIEATVGLLMGAGLSLSVIIVGLYFPAFLRFVTPALIASQVVPLIVLAPFFVIAFGIGMTSKIAMATVLCFFPTFVSLVQGYRLIPQSVHDLLDIYNAPITRRIWRVYLPMALPSGMAGLKVSATLSVIGAIVAEFTGSQIGLGRNLFLSTIRLQPDLMIVSLLNAAILGSVMFGTVALVERTIGGWYLKNPVGE